MSYKPARTTAYLFLLGNTLVWGLALPIAKKAFNAGLSPASFLLGRFLLAAIISLPLLFLKPKQIKKINQGHNLITIILLELIGTVFALYLLYLGTELTTSLDATLIAITWPLLVTLGGITFLHEKEQKNEWVGLLLAMIGTFLLVALPIIKVGLNGDIKGNLLVLAQNVVVAGYYLLAKKYYQGLDKWLVTHISFWVGVFGFAAITLYQGLSPVTEIINLFSYASPWPLISVIYMGIFGSIIGLTFYLIGQDKIEASEASIFTYLQPIVTIPASFILLSEVISPIQIFAALIIGLGVYTASKR